MIVETALKLAGPGAHLVARPRGRVHVYTGSLTRSGRSVPGTARALCRTRTRRLEVVASLRPSSLDLDAPTWGVLCGRCSARLAPLQSRAEQPTTRAGFLATYADTTATDLAIALQLAQTPAEVDAAAHLSLVLFDVAGTLQPVTDRGRAWPALHHLVHDARTRVHGFPESLYRDRERDAVVSAAAREAGAARRKEARADREARVNRLGFAHTHPTGPRRNERRS